MNRKPSPPPITVGFISLGCAKNLVDSQIMAASLLRGGLVMAQRPEAADVVIVNTCAFIETAREESIEGILSACRLKDTGTVRAVLVAGCLPQRYRKELAESLPEVDGFIGLDEIEEVPEIVTKLAGGVHGLYKVSERATRLFDPGDQGVVFSGGPFAYLKIAEGCNHSCAFCAIPGIRGTHRSRPLPGIVEEAGRLLDAGYRELDLVSQDATYYGHDLKDGSSLTKLLYALAACADGRDATPFWIRIIYGYPEGITPELIHAIRDIPQVCAYIDVPIQHSHPAILKAMRRAGTIEPVITMVERLREAIPDVALRTTCLVGFPGETDEHFEHLLNHVSEIAFDHLGVFAFSPEENTPAYDMPDRPAPKVAEERRHILMTAQRTIVDRKARELIGTETSVLIENPLPESPGAWSARSYRQAPEVDGEIVVENVPPEIQSGDFARVRYIAQADYDMKAVIVDA